MDSSLKTPYFLLRATVFVGIVQRRKYSYSLESIVLETVVVLLVLVWEVWYVVIRREIIFIATFEHIMSAKKLRFGAYLVSGSYALRGS